MALPTLTGTGRLTDAPELRFTPSGKAVCKVRLAFNSRRKNQQTQEWEDGDVFYIDGSVWGDEAEHVAESLDRGMEVVVSGETRTRQYETKDGEKRTVVELNIRSIGPSLRYATAKVQKMARTGGGFGGAGGGPGAAAPSGPANNPWDSEPPF